MRVRRIVPVLVAAVITAGVLGSVAMGQKGLGKQEAAKDRLREADQAWLKVFAGKDLDRSVEFMEADGSMMSPNQPIATGHDAVRKQFSGFFGLNNFTISCAPERVYVAHSGELGYTSGAYTFSFADPSGKQVSDKGKYVTVWTKHADGWKVTMDIFNSDAPAGGQ
jgi:ketosteroid isomerase-like protein